MLSEIGVPLKGLKIEWMPLTIMDKHVFETIHDATKHRYSTFVTSIRGPQCFRITIDVITHEIRLIRGFISPEIHPELRCCGNQAIGDLEIFQFLNIPIE